MQQAAQLLWYMPAVAQVLLVCYILFTVACCVHAQLLRSAMPVPINQYLVSMFITVLMLIDLLYFVPHLRSASLLSLDLLLAEPSSTA